MFTEEEKGNGKKTIVIFGVSSFVGSNLAETLKKDYRIIGTYYSNPTRIPGILTLPCNVLTKDEVQLILFTFRPDITVYCAGLSSVYECSVSTKLAGALNTSGLFNVAEFCQRYKSLICYFSSGFVFGGEKRTHSDLDTLGASTVYGKTQAAAEFYLQKMALSYIIFRTCKIYGRSLRIEQLTWFEEMQKKIKNRETVNCDNALKLGFIDVSYIAMIVKTCFDRDIYNQLFQISSKDIISHYEFARIYCSIFKENEQFLIGNNWPFPIVEDSSSLFEEDSNAHFQLDVEGTESSLDITLPTVTESLKLTHRRFFGQDRKNKKEKLSDEISFI